MKKLLSTCLLMAAAMTVMAVPAKRGVWKTLTLSDGTAVKAQLTGDEFGHFWTADDGRTYKATADGFYAPADRQTITTRAKARRQQANARRMQRMPRQRIGSSAAYTGQKKGLILLVNFTDKKFKTANDNALYQRIANEEGFAEGKFKGSMADYFKAQSLGQFELDFDVMGPLTVSHRYSYYGQNDSNDEDMHPGEMVIEAVNLAKSQVSNWQQYDWDGDGEVDQVYVIYAGYGEADQENDANVIWPHAFDLATAQHYGDGSGPVTVATGLKVNTYACGPELDGQTGQIGGIGTMCHEFSHCLGYPDFYDIDYSGGQGMGPWDLMDQGSYNGDGYQPAGYTSYERWEAGWTEPTVLETEDVTVDALGDLQSTGKSYVIYNKGNRNEYYLLENRQLTGWDASLPAAGLLILHCDYDATVWMNNEPNDDPNHQRMTVVPADGTYKTFRWMGETYFDDEDMLTDPFPQAGVTAFNKNFKTKDNVAKKAAQLFTKNTNGTYWIDSSVEQIKQNTDGTIAFRFVAAGGSGETPDNPDNPVTGDYLFYESFDQCSGKGGNDDLWSGTIASANFVADHDDWTVTRAGGANKCAKFGNSSTTGSATTPVIALTGEAKLTFRAGAWNSTKDDVTLNLMATGGTVTPTSVTMQRGAFTDFDVTVTGQGALTITFESAKGRFFLDEVMVTNPNAAAIDDSRLSTTDSGQATVVYDLQGRRLSGSPQQKGIYIVNGRKVAIR